MLIIGEQIINLIEDQINTPIQTNYKIQTMQTTFQYQQKPNIDKSVKYILPGSLQDTYKKYDSNTENVLRDTQKCPFTSIRELIIAFKRTDPYVTNGQLSDLLQQKYRANPQLQRIDKQLNTCITQAQLSQIRFKKLSICADYYNNLRNQLSKSQQSEQKFQIRGSQVQQRNRLFQKQNKDYLQKQNKYFQCMTYSQELERALALGSLAQSHKFGPNSSQNNQIINSVQSFENLSEITSRMNQQFDSCLNNLQEQLFQWREKSKHDFITPQSFTKPNKLISQWKKKSGSIEQAYAQMGNFSSWMQQDRNELKRIEQNNRRQYQVFLPKFINAKQIYKVSSQNSDYLNIIRGEKKKLEMHLRSHYGLIVPYAVSDDYAKMIIPLQNPRNRELKGLVGDELVPLEQGLSYVNQSYEKLYRDACDDVNGKLGVRNRVQEYLKKFTGYSQNPNQENTFCFHLIQSCRKIMRIVR